MDNERYVRSVWPNISSYWSNSVSQPTFCLSLGLIWHEGLSAGYFKTESEAWSAAAEFTREHEEKVRQLREEVGSTKSSIRWFDQGGSYEDNQQSAIHRRILARLEAELTKFTAGMKQEAL